MDNERQIARAHAYRLGFAVKVLGAGGLKSSDSRRWQSGPHLSRSLELLESVFEYLDSVGIRMYRLSSSTVPYGTHPDLPELDHRRQIDACAEQLAALGAAARRLGIRLSTHPGQYTVLNAPDPELTRKSALDLEQDALLLDALGAGPEAVVVIHAGGLYGDRAAALRRWARAYESLSDRARRRVVLEHDEHAFDLGDALELHRRTGVPVVYDDHHHRCNPAAGLERREDALRAAYGTWPDGVRPKVHLSSSRLELRTFERRRAHVRGRDVKVAPPLLEQHADFVSPWEAEALLRAAPGPLDVMIEAKAKDLAVIWLRRQLERLAPDLAAAEELSLNVQAGRAPRRRARAGRSPARTRARS